MAAWKNYQNEVCDFFHTLGMSAETDVRVRGIRTDHDIDVLVKSTYAGMDIVWVVECKRWKTKISKLHILGLRQIVTDIGSDRGILLSETGFQSGALEAAALTNVQLTSLADLKQKTSDQIALIKIREIFDLLEKCQSRYWDIPKSKRIESGLRPEVYDIGYSGDHIITYCRDVLTHAMRGVFPISIETIQTVAYPVLKRDFLNVHEVIIALEALIRELDVKLTNAEKLCASKA